MNFVLGLWLTVYLLAAGACGQTGTATDAVGDRQSYGD